MAKGKRNGKGHELRYAAYKQERRWEKNRKLKLARALKLAPDNKQIAEAVVVYRRTTPTTKVWSATNRRIAELFKEFSGRADKDLFSKNEKLAAVTLMKPSKVAELARAEKTKKPVLPMFALGTRVVLN